MTRFQSSTNAPYTTLTNKKQHPRYVLITYPNNHVSSTNNLKILLVQHNQPLFSHTMNHACLLCLFVHDPMANI